MLSGLRNTLKTGHDPHAAAAVRRYHGNESAIYRVFRALLHGWTTLVWFAMCVVIAAVVAGLWGAAPVLALIAAVGMSAFISLGSLIGGVRTARSVFTSTLIRAVILAILIRILL